MMDVTLNDLGIQHMVIVRAKEGARTITRARGLVHGREVAVEVPTFDVEDAARRLLVAAARGDA